MIRPLRYRHRIFWMALPAAALSIIAAGLWARRSPAPAPSADIQPRSVP
jgi:hypothetical protein